MEEVEAFTLGILEAAATATKAEVSVCWRNCAVAALISSTGSNLQSEMGLKITSVFVESGTEALDKDITCSLFFRIKLHTILAVSPIP